MSKKMRYYRTAALLGPQEQHVAFRATPQPIKVPWKLVALFGVVLAFVLWLNLDNAWFLMWDDLTVRGVADPEVVMDIKERSDLLGYHRFFLNPQRAVEPVLTAMPQFESAEVHCGLFPTKCTLAVTPRAPVLVWVANGQRYWVDAAGVFYPPQGERPDLSTITGPAPEEVDVDAFTAVYQGIQALTSVTLAPTPMGISHPFSSDTRALLSGPTSATPGTSGPGKR